MTYTQVGFFLAFRLYPSCFLSFSVCCILIFCMDHFSVIDIFIDPLKADEWELFVGDGFSLYNQWLLLFQEAPGTAVTLTLTVTIPFLWRRMNRSSQMGWDGQKDRWEFLFLTSVDFSWRFVMRNRLLKRASRNRFQPREGCGDGFVPGPRIPNCGPA